MKLLLFQKENNMAFVTFNRPEILNAVDAEMYLEISSLVDEIETDPEIKVIIFTGAGEKAFIAGGDIKEMSTYGSLEAMKLMEAAKKGINSIRNSSKITIAAINGYALGGGCEIALACDFRVASEKATLGLPEITLGIIPGAGGTQTLARLVGACKAKELILTGGFVKADMALKIGLINQIAPADTLFEETKKYADQFITKSTLAMKMAKSAIDKGIEMSLDEGLMYESQVFSLLFSGYDQKEGMSAFLEKRKPNFKK